MLAVLVNREWFVEELLICCVVATLSARLLDGGDDVVWSAATKLYNFRSLRPIDIVTVMIIMVAVAVVIATDAVIIAPFFTAVVIAT